MIDVKIIVRDNGRDPLLDNVLSECKEALFRITQEIRDYCGQIQEVNLVEEKERVEFLSMLLSFFSLSSIGAEYDRIRENLDFTRGISIEDAVKSIHAVEEKLREDPDLISKLAVNIAAQIDHERQDPFVKYLSVEGMDTAIKAALIGIKPKIRESEKK